MGCCETGFIREPLDRIGKVELVSTHHVVNRGAMRAATEAMKEPLVLDDIERGAIVVVERAAAGIFSARRAGELHVPAYQIGQIYPAAHLIEEVLRKDHVHCPLAASCVL
jgi:hypothetical protein